MNLPQPNQLCRQPRSVHTSFVTASLAIVLLSATSTMLPAQSVGAESANVIEEIIVTARKREESLQETPVVVSALSSKTISDFSIDSMEDIADFTPGLLTVTSGVGSGGMLTLRGIGSGTSSAAIDQAVSVVVDDMQVASMQIRNSAMIDMQSVQTYKGPQALFFGKNSPGGVLSIRTADPGEEFEGQMKTGYEIEADEWFVQGMVSGPISDNAAGRLVVRYTESDGLLDVESGPFPESFGGRAPAAESTFARGTLILTPQDDLTIRAKLSYNEIDGDVGGGVWVQRVYCPFGAPLGGSLPFNCKANGTVQIADLPQEAIDVLAAAGIDMGPTGAHDNEQWLATVALDYAINDDLTFSSVSGFYDVYDLQPYSPVFGLFPAFILPAPETDHTQFTQEFRLASSFDGAVNFVSGLFYEQKDLETYLPIAADIGPAIGLPVPFWLQVANTEYDQESTAFSAFVDITWEITENLELSGGARYSWEEKEFAGVAGFIGEEKNDWDDVSPQLTLSWRPNDDWMVFASYREGFKSGGFDGSFRTTPTAPSSYEPEEVEGFELGAKGTLLDGTLQLNAAIYSYDYDNLQLGRFEAETNSAAIVNAAEAEISGIELNFVWLTPLEGLLARASIAYNDSEYNEFVGDCYGGQSISNGCNLNFLNGAFISQDLSGEPLRRAPEFVGNLGLSYEQHIGNVILGLNLDVLYSDEFENDNENRPALIQDSYSKVNAAIRLSNPADTWYVALIGRNLTNEYVVYSAGAAPTAPGIGTGTEVGIPQDAIGWVGFGRTFALELGYTF